METYIFKLMGRRNTQIAILPIESENLPKHEEIVDKINESGYKDVVCTYNLVSTKRLINDVNLNEERVQMVVLEEHTLGYLIPNMGNLYLDVLSASVTKGAPSHYGKNGNFVSVENKNIRLATEEDFQKFRVQIEGYKNEEDILYNRKK